VSAWGLGGPKEESANLRPQYRRYMGVLRLGGQKCSHPWPEERLPNPRWQGSMLLPVKYRSYWCG
jgi:hypothetical protein